MLNVQIIIKIAEKRRKLTTMFQTLIKEVFINIYIINRKSKHCSPSNNLGQG